MEELKTKIFNNKGIGLVEAVLAITFAIVVIVTLIGLINFNLQNSTNVTIRQDAVRNQVNVLEKLKLDKETNYTNFSNAVIGRCYSSQCYYNADTITSGCNTDSELLSCFKISTAGSTGVNVINVDIITYFKVRGTSFSTPLSTVFTNWRRQ
jgi:hypothetical protein